MLNIGRAGQLFEVQQSVVVEDANGAPYSTWETYATVYAEVEGAETSNDTANVNSHNAIQSTMTLIVRCHPSQNFMPSMRAIQQENNIIYAITAVRYNYRKDTAWIDCNGGVSTGGVA